MLSIYILPLQSVSRHGFCTFVSPDQTRQVVCALKCYEVGTGRRLKRASTQKRLPEKIRIGKMRFRGRGVKQAEAGVETVVAEEKRGNTTKGEYPRAVAVRKEDRVGERRSEEVRKG